MHPVLAKVPASDAEADSYAVSAEFYDILQAHEDDRRVRRLYGQAVARARLGVLDIGAGTGRVTSMSLAESGAAVHAVEPARAMRAVLMSRLAALPAKQRARVSVYPCTLDKADLHGIADVAICHNTIACLTPAARQTLWPSLSAALVPGGRLLLELPPGRLPAKDVVRVLPIQRVGEHEYGGRMVLSAAGDRIRTHFDYWVRGRYGPLRQDSETFWMWPAARSEVLDALQGHGFDTLSAHRDPAVLAVTLRHTP